MNVAQMVEGRRGSADRRRRTSRAEGLDLAVGKDGKVYLSFYDGNGAVQMLTGTTAGRGAVTKVADADRHPRPRPRPSALASRRSSTSSSGNFEPTTGVAVDDNGVAYVTWYDGTTDQSRTWPPSTAARSPSLQTAGHGECGAYPSVAVNGRRLPGLPVVVRTARTRTCCMGIHGDVSGQAVAAPSPAASVTAAPPSRRTAATDGKVALDEVAQNIVVQDHLPRGSRGQGLLDQLRQHGPGRHPQHRRVQELHVHVVHLHGRPTSPARTRPPTTSPASRTARRRAPTTSTATSTPPRCSAVLAVVQAQVAARPPGLVPAPSRMTG